MFINGHRLNCTSNRLYYNSILFSIRTTIIKKIGESTSMHNISNHMNAHNSLLSNNKRENYKDILKNLSFPSYINQRNSLNKSNNTYYNKDYYSQYCQLYNMTINEIINENDNNEADSNKKEDNKTDESALSDIREEINYFIQFHKKFVHKYDGFAITNNYSNSCINNYIKNSNNELTKEAIMSDIGVETLLYINNFMNKKLLNEHQAHK